MYIYTILFGIIGVEPATLHIKLKAGTSVRLGTYRNAFCVEEMHRRIDARRNLLSLTVARVLICLPAYAAEFETIQAFKESLNKINFCVRLTIK